MYKVFFNDSFFILSQKALPENENKIQYLPLQNSNQLFVWLMEAEKTKNPMFCIFIHDSPSTIWDDFCKNIKIVSAAGGLVKNKSGEYLFIFRRGKWDLPKGKIDKGEKIVDAAIREVQEETGVSDILIDGEAFITYHVYMLKGKLALKPTYWYAMVNKGNNDLSPQTSEDIEKAVWLNSIEIKEIRKNAFGTILEVIDFYGICKK